MPRERLRRLLGGGAPAILVAAGLVLVAGGPTASAAPGQVSGVVFEDHNANGAKDAGSASSATDGGVGGVTVTAYGADGAAVGSTTSAADGTWSLAVTTSVRVEFTGLPAGYESGPHGTGAGVVSRTSVQFAAPGDTNVDYGVLRPADYCKDNPDLATSCFGFGGAADFAARFAGIRVFPYTASGVTRNAADRTVAADSEVGAVYGLAYDKYSKKLFASAYVRRHAILGGSLGGGSSTIYLTDPATGGPSVFTTVAGAGAVNRPAGFSDWMHDPATFPLIANTGLGDIDLAEDGSALYTVNLYNRTLVTIPIVRGGALPTAGAPTATAFPLALPGAAQGCTGAANASFTPANPADTTNPWLRPFGLGVRGGLVYAGLVCAGPTTDALRAYVYTWNGTAWSGAPVLEFSLAAFNGLRGAVAQNNFAIPANWRPWTNTFSDLVGTRPWSDFPGTKAIVGPQPMLSDIVFDGTAMVIGIRDRTGDQGGNFAGSPDPADPTLYETYAGGDLLRACAAGAAWTIEGTPGCPRTGNEFYKRENFVPIHDETSLGGVAQVPGFGNVALTAYDPFTNAPAGGVIQLSNTDGSKVNGYELYAGAPGLPDPATFGKANGLGDLEAVCDQAPLEIGNFVWLDTNGNGRQDPGEPPLPGATVTVTGPGGTVTRITDANGQYYVPVLPNSTYTVTVTPPAGYGATTVNAPGTTPLNDSSNPAGTQVVTGGPGANDHTWDFGFVAATPGYTLLKEVWDPPTGTWLDGDADVGSPGSNLGDAGRYQVGDAARYRMTVTNTGNVALATIRLVDPWCGLDTVLPTLAAGASTQVECTHANVTIDDNNHINTARTTGATPVTCGGSGTPPGEGGGCPPLTELVERARIVVTVVPTTPPPPTVVVTTAVPPPCTTSPCLPATGSGTSPVTWGWLLVGLGGALWFVTRLRPRSRRSGT